ncbi:hypothetical protein PoB_000032900 [Plakobranchus ocellatus]|uniref:Secreted protein n=1 Tax=Plakobranchus ocellatus TaxID=259542 RepID=A0AAV3XVM2_9GAST|nr:hypothetical protein PoB_000032900 [Plakobranchus ocellatus]
MKIWACTCTVVCRMLIALTSVNSQVIIPDGLTLHSDVIVLIATFCAAKAQFINELHIKGWDNLQADFESTITASKTLLIKWLPTSDNVSACAGCSAQARR